MRGQGPRGGRPRLREADAPAGEPLQVRSRRPFISIGAQAIGPHRVEHDQQDIRRAAGGGDAPDGRAPRRDHLVQERRPGQRGRRRRPAPAGYAAPATGTAARSGRSAATADRPRRGRAPRTPRRGTADGSRVRKRHRGSRRAVRQPRGQPGPEDRQCGRHQPDSDEEHQVGHRDHPDDMPVHPEEQRARVAEPLLGQDEAELDQPDDQPEPGRTIAARPSPPRAAGRTIAPGTPIGPPRSARAGATSREASMNRSSFRFG